MIRPSLSLTSTFSHEGIFWGRFCDSLVYFFIHIALSSQFPCVSVSDLHVLYRTEAYVIARCETGGHCIVIHGKVAEAFIFMVRTWR
jgi:hypothetical protein